jgi:flagellar biosynthesis GTPase FlhF
MAEKEEAFKKRDEEKKRKEELEEQEKDKKLRLANEKLRKERPQHLEELLRMDLESAPARELKGIMEKMGISSLGCLSKKDLKEKLMDGVPELRFRVSNESSPSSGERACATP